MKEVLYIFIVFTIIFGLYFTAKALFFMHGYYTDIGSSVRHEYIQGALLSALASLPFWLLTSAASFFIRKSLSNAVYVILNIPSVLLSASFIVMLLYILYSALVDR